MSHTTYELTNSYYGSSSSLEVDTSSPSLELHAASSGTALTWTFTAAANDKYNICTTYNNTDYCLDIVNNGGTCPQDCTTPHLATPGSDAGQQWTALQQSGGYVKLSNDFTGTGWYLDTYSNTAEAFMSEGDYSGQYWDLKIVSQGSSSSATVVALPSATSSTIVSGTELTSTPIAVGYIYKTTCHIC